MESILRGKTITDISMYTYTHTCTHGRAGERQIDRQTDRQRQEQTHTHTHTHTHTERERERDERKVRDDFAQRTPILNARKRQHTTGDREFT